MRWLAEQRVYACKRRLKRLGLYVANFVHGNIEIAS